MGYVNTGVCLVVVMLFMTVVTSPALAIQPTVNATAPQMAPGQDPCGVYGQVTDENNAPVPDAYVALVDANNTSIAYYQQTTGSNGDYIFHVVNTSVAYRVYVNCSWKEMSVGPEHFQQNESYPINFMMSRPAATPTAVPTEKTGTPGFEGIFAILGLMGVVILLSGLKGGKY